MKNLYKIIAKNGVTICFQVAKTKDNAINFAKMYGYKGVVDAVFVREE